MRFIFAFLLSFNALAYELIEIKAVSTSKKTFVTRQGKKEGISPGKKGTFTYKNLSFVAQAKTVGREFTQWEVTSEDLSIPFSSGNVVTYNDATEYIWTLTPHKTRKEYLQRYFSDERRSFIVKTSFTRGLNSTVSRVNTAETGRGGVYAEGLYEFSLNNVWSLNGGLRYEQERIGVSGSTVDTYRILAVGNLSYFFDYWESFYDSRPYLSLGFGYGLSGTQSGNLTQEGVAAILPALRGGLTIPITKEFEMIAELGLETMSTVESGGGVAETTTDQTNGTLGFGLRRNF